MRCVVFVCALVCLCQVVLGQAIGCNGGLGIPNNPLIGNPLAPGLPNPNALGVGNPINGLANPAAAVAANLAGMPIPTPAGFGDVAIAGELPVAGSTAVVGNVPIVGFVTFEGIVPASGMVSLANNCDCNPLF